MTAVLRCAICMLTLEPLYGDDLEQLSLIEGNLLCYRHAIHVLSAGSFAAGLDIARQENES